MEKRRDCCSLKVVFFSFFRLFFCSFFCSSVTVPVVSGSVVLSLVDSVVVGSPFGLLDDSMLISSFTFIRFLS